MRYFGSSFKFVFRNFLYLAVFCAGPSLIMAYYYRDNSIFDFFKGLFSDTPPADSYIYFSFISNETWYFAIGTLLLIGFTFSAVFAYVNRVLKIGSRSIVKSFKKTTETIVPVFLVLFVLIVIVQIFALLAYGLIELMLMSSASVYRPIIPVILTLIYSIMLFLIFKLFMTIPTMLTLGYKFRESIGYSIKLSVGFIFKFVLATLFIVLIIIGLSCFSNVLYDALWFGLIIGTINYMLVLMYFPALMMVAFYDINGMNRLDIKRKFIYS